MSTDLLSRLADVETPAPTPDLAGVQRRARALRRRRHARTGGAALGLAAALTVGGAVLPGGGPEPTAGGFPLTLGAAPAAADAGTAECTTGWSEWVDRDDWADDARITGAAALLDDAPWAPTSAGVHLTRMDCVSALPAAVLLDPDPVRGITVWADVADPFPPGTEDVTSTTVREAAGRSRMFSGSELVTWSEDGTRWLASGSGLTHDDLVAALDGLRFDGRALDPGSVPAGFLPVTTGPDARTDRETLRWTVTYGDTVPVPGEDGVHRSPVGAGATLEVTTAAVEPPEVVASYWAEHTVLVDLGRGRAVFTPWGDPAVDVGGWLRWQVDGVTYSLSAALPLPDLVALAESVGPVSVDDARLTGLPEWVG